MFYLIQLLNAVQYGLLLFLLASGLTLIFGIMGVINLAHGSFYMVGAYLCYWLAGLTGNLWLAVPITLLIAFAVGLLLETTVIPPSLPARSSLSGVAHLRFDSGL